MDEKLAKVKGCVLDRIWQLQLEHWQQVATE